MRALNRLSLRLRLTLAFAGAAAVLLAAIGTFVVLRVQAGLDGELDHALRLRAAELAQSTRDLSRVRAIIDAAGQPAQVLDARGRVLASVRVTGGRPLVRAHLAEARRGEVIYESHERTRLLARPAPGNRIMVVATSMRTRERTLETLRGVLLIGLPIALLLASVAGYAVAAGALRPVERMRARAARISAATVDARLPLPAAEDELRRLGETLNEMLERLAVTAENERGFLSTASHELRAPLAILKARSSSRCTPSRRRRTGTRRSCRRGRRPTGWGASPRTSCCSRARRRAPRRTRSRRSRSRRSPSGC